MKGKIWWEQWGKEEEEQRRLGDQEMCVCLAGENSGEFIVHERAISCVKVEAVDVFPPIEDFPGSIFGGLDEC